MKERQTPQTDFFNELQTELMELMQAGLTNQQIHIICAERTLAAVFQSQEQDVDWDAHDTFWDWMYKTVGAPPSLHTVESSEDSSYRR